MSRVGRIAPFYPNGYSLPQVGAIAPETDEKESRAIIQQFKLNVTQRSA